MSADQATLILGCGFSGAVLAQRLAFRGRFVVGTTRSEQQASVIRTRGAQALIVDTSDLSPLDRFKGRVHKVVCAIPPRVARDGSYEDATAELLARYAAEGVERFVYISATSVYGDKGGALVTEETECTPDSPRGAARLEIEQLVLQSPISSCVVRAAGIYGPGRSQLHRMAARRLRIVGEGAAMTNRIHVHDLVSTMDKALKADRDGAIYLASDARPSRQDEVAAFVVREMGMPEPTRLSDGEARVRMTPSVYRMITGSKRLDATATRAELGVRLRYPDYEAGLRAIWNQERAAIEGIRDDLQTG